MAKRKRRHRSLDEARALLAEALARGLTRRALAKELGVHPNTIGYWIRRERDHDARRARPARSASAELARSPAATLVPVRILEPRRPAGSTPVIELVVPRSREDRRVVVRVPSGVDADDLRAVLEVLEERAC